ncbi:immune inhibitor A domain-containing protein [Fonticella tunisiensis]|uniref:Antibacterial peptide protease n=1 Tax=Fonticella tunisiensis TaxID=1096341 RepID=A0A4R7KQM3_9CLOT|nr:immune inhibitor A domain-containing protein [Fonticella tunisiensis]TDT61006.1 antibacterial peptide protease [Fonticella tunisiensis]
MNKKILAGVTSLLLLLGSTSTFAAKGPSAYAEEGQNAPSYAENQFYKNGGPVDLSIANEEKIIEMLKIEGKIPKDAAYEEAHKAYIKYMQERSKGNQKQKPLKMERNLKAKQSQRVQKYVFEKSKPDLNPKKVNILVLLVEYSDYKHNSIQANETDMYYKDYSHEHFQDMIFGDDGYTGPNGEKLISMKQYYREQSGGSLVVEGKVAGWYTLPQSAAYYGGNVGDSGNDARPRTAVAQALQLAAKDPSINLNDFDKEDIYDLDNDGNLNEPDGIIDYLMVIHAGVGEEAGGGSLGSNAIWSHSWNLGGVYPIPNTSTEVSYWGGKLAAYAYTIEPEDGASGVFAHEFGHNLGLPDEYDTIYSSAAGEPISYWSIMSSGSWAGKIPGTEPSGFSPYAKQFFQAVYGGNWQKAVNIDYDKLTSAGARITLRQADEEGQVVRISLPDKAHKITVPASGKYAYWGGKGSDGTPILTNMTASVDLTGKASATLKFKTWYDIEEGWDFASVQAREVGTNEWTYIQGNITTTEGVEGRDVVVPHGITGASNGWVDGIFDLSAFAGKNIELKFEYATDSYSFGAGFYVDDIQVVSEGSVVLSDDAEEAPKFTFNGFEKSTGTVYAPHYYLVEWRNHHGVDTGLAHISTLGQVFSYDPGMVLWYVDEYYTDNWTGYHPGDGYLGIVDADQHSVLWQWTDPKLKPALTSGKYQMHDAAFSKDKEAEVNVDLTETYGRTAVDTYRFTESKFDDRRDYSNPEIPELGRNIPKYGLTIEIAHQASDNSSASIIIKK